MSGEKRTKKKKSIFEKLLSSKKVEFRVELRNIEQEILIECFAKSFFYG